MKIYSLKTVQTLPISMDEAWEFFTSPYNLAKITPKSLNFKVLTKIEGSVYPGMIITYKVHPILGIPIQWVTEITHFEKHHLFVDEQRFGPYAFWHHMHKFTESVDGVEMEDIVHYSLPFGFIGNIAHALFVRSKLESIFDYRAEKLKELFNSN